MEKKTLNLLSWIMVLLLIFGVIIHIIGYYMFKWDDYPFYGHMSMMMPFGIIFMFAFWFFVIYLFVRLLDVKDIKKKNTSKDILDERLSKGEISIHEYEEIIKKIKE